MIPARPVTPAGGGPVSFAVMKDSPEVITQATPISEVASLLLGNDAIVVKQGDSLQHLAGRAVEQPGCRVIAVVDDDGRMIGLVPVRLLVNDIFLKIVPEEFLGVIHDVDDVLEYAQHIRARTAGDIMLEPVSVHGDASVRDAFEIMHKARLNGLPVVNADARVVGYLDQLELLLAWIDATGREALLRPTDHPAPHR